MRRPTLPQRLWALPVAFSMAMAGAISLSGPAHAAVPPPPAAPAVAIVPTVSVIAGTGTDGPLLNNIPANTAQLFGPIDVAAAPNGDVFIADANHQQIRIIGADSKIQPALGTGVAGCDPSGGTVLWQPKGLATDAQGNVYVSNSLCGLVEKLEPDGTVTVVAGHEDPNGNYSPTITDGMPATQAFLNQPGGLSYDDATGTLYIADTFSNRILKVVGGNISVAVGTGSTGFSGDGGPATAATLNVPRDVLFSGGVLYIADSGNCRVRAVNSSETITTLIGTGSCSDFGDGGPATSAGIAGVSGLATDAAGNLFIAAGISGAIRELDTTGVVSTVTSIFGGGLGGIAFTPDGNLLVSAAGLSQEIFKISGLTPPIITPPPPPDGKQHGSVSGVSWTVTPTTPLWNMDVTVNASQVTCPATLVITVGTWQKRPIVCGIGGTPPSSFTFKWKVFNATLSLPPGQNVPISAFVAKSDAPRYGGASTTLVVPVRPAAVGVGDSYLSGHHQDTDEPFCQAPPAPPNPLCSAPRDYQPNDPNFSWVTRTVNKLNKNIPTEWQYEYDNSHLLARSGATTSDMFAQGQIDNMAAILRLHPSSWNLVAFSGGANDMGFAKALEDFYTKNNHPPFPLAPWAVKNWSDCPDLQGVFSRLQGQKATITTNLLELLRRGRESSSSARYIDLLYPYALKPDNICNKDLQVPTDPANPGGPTTTWHGAKSVVDELDALHRSLPGGDITRLDLSSVFGVNPLLKLQLFRNYGYPHPSDIGQSLTANQTVKLLTH